MTIVNKDSTSHSGLLVTGSGDDIDIDVELIGGRTLRMSAAGDELGAWPIDECHIEPDPDRNGAFRIVVDGDDAIFTPVDPVGFHAFLDRVAGADGDGGGNGQTELRSDPLGAALDSLSSPADDPVAFLFGSAPPPVAAPPGDETGAETSSEADNDLVPEAETDEPADVGGDHVPSVPDDIDFEWDEPDSHEVEVTIEQDSHGAPVGEEAIDAESHPSDAAEEPPLPASPILAQRLEEAELLEAAAADAESAPDSADITREKFGPSAFDRLSDAISSVTSSKSTTSEDGDEDDDAYLVGPSTVAEETLTTQRALRDHRLKGTKRKQRLKLAAVVGGVVGVVAVLALLAPGAIEFIQSYEGDAEPPPTLPISETTVAPTTTVPVDTTVADTSTTTTIVSGPAGAELFSQPAPEFVARWDAAGGVVDDVLTFESNPIVGPFEERFTPYLSMVGVVEDDGTLGDFSIVVDPSGPTEYDRIGIQALGVAIATVDPARSPQGRAALLGELGLDVREPQLAGIDGFVESNGVTYAMVYDPETTLLTLTVAPAG